MSSAPSDTYSAVFAAVAASDAEARTFADEVRILFLRQVTVEGIDVLIKHHLYSRKIRAVVEFGGYGTMIQDLLATDGLATAFRPDIIVLALAIEDLDPKYGAPGWNHELALMELKNLFKLLLERTSSIILVHSFAPPMWPEQGLVTDSNRRDLGSQIATLNQFVVEEVRANAPRFVLFDLPLVLQRIGAEAAFDERSRRLWRAPYRRPFLDAWAKHIGQMAAALKGRAKKVIVLDCDNTLWGGVVGEDGIDGVGLDGNQHPGRVFFDFQTSLLHLAERGVLLTLCSKNNEADVFEVLDRHPWSQLKRKHLAAWRVNWQDKAKNIEELAQELNLGLDAFVFVDDNPMECGLVSQLLPQVTVLQVPKRLHELPTMLFKSGLFDTLQVTAEDRSRAQLYQSEGERKAVRASYADVTEYLKSMETVAVIRPAMPGEIARIAQLTQKTNQFNLTTRRYSESEILAMTNSDHAAVYGLTARDRFGSLGLVGVMIFRFANGVGSIDSFLMSCRALGRNLENAMVEHCFADIVKDRPLMRWEAEFRPTAKNGQVADFWLQHGFVESPENGFGVKRYWRSADAAVDLRPTYVTIFKD